MLEVKKGIKLRGNVASVIASLEKRQKNKYSNGVPNMKEVSDKKEDCKDENLIGKCIIVIFC